MAVLGVAAALATFFGGPLAVPVLRVALGATVVSVLLGALSVGFLYLPGAILLLASGVLCVSAAGRRVPAYLLWFVGGALIQGIVICWKLRYRERRTCRISGAEPVISSSRGIGRPGGRTQDEAQ